MGGVGWGNVGEGVVGMITEYGRISSYTHFADPSRSRIRRQI